jgi:3D (Asp-Asp-Asp) domain-containing protein
MKGRRACLILPALLAGLAGDPSEARPARNVVFRVEATAYCRVGETASGAYTRRGIVAADPNLLPLGTRIRVQGLGRDLDGVYDVEDTGREIKGRELDIFMRNCRQAKAFGRRPAQVKVLRIGTGERVDQRER